MRWNPPSLLSSCQSTKETPFLGWQELKESLALAIASSSRCSSPRQLQKLHARVILSGLRHNLHLCGLLVGGYSSFGDVVTARQVFDTQRLPPTKALLWNTLIRGCLRSGRPDLALRTFGEMMERSPACVPDGNTFNLAIKACTDMSDFEFGYWIADMVRSRDVGSDLLVATALVDMYSRTGDLNAARELFDKLTVRDAVSWNAMISGYAREGSFLEAVYLYKAMKDENGVAPSQATLVALLSVCGKIRSLKHGDLFHAHVIRLGFGADLFISNALMEMYIDCNRLDISSLLFDGLALKDPVSWSTLIGGYVRHQRPHDAIKLFRYLGDWQQGLQIEEEFLRSDVRPCELDVRLITALIYLYAKCGKSDISLKLFDKNVVVRNDVIAWNALLKGCAEVGDVYKVSEFTMEMQRRGIIPDDVTFLTLLTTFSSTPLLRMGMTVHAHILKRGFLRENFISNALIDLYSQCGSIKDSREVFNEIVDKDVVTWSLMLKAYAQNGSVDEALGLFHQMRETATRPNHITFISILSACSHGGYVDKGQELFKCMKEEYGLEPGLEHHGCMVALFSRAGLLSEAYDLIKNGPIETSNASALWGTLLNACSVHGNWYIGEAVARHLFRLEPRNAANYVILANIYLSAGKREDANHVLRLMRAKGLEKNPGFSWSEGG
ncbi:hypothetical protein Taro_049516 [Colocasia esculenta]|uniref:Pentatricopeptide repeat-containing protein n=1 Tax=Colocasia esculenta TaxID=4460 RepID=A0A843XB38_COLES|nr:hypothetical protein [Colocasia esculenta]